ncbi:hypothetical protein WDU94_004871 [Cyamophila willieti]
MYLHTLSRMLLIFRGQLLQYPSRLRTQQHRNRTLLLARVCTRSFFKPSGFTNPVCAQFMFSQVACLCKRFPAYLARVGLNPRVYPLVPVQIGLLDERLGTVATVIGSLPGVQAIVLNKVCLLGESFAAQFA